MAEKGVIVQGIRDTLIGGTNKLIVGEELTIATVNVAGDPDYDNQELGNMCLLSDKEAKLRGMATEETLTTAKDYLNTLTNEKAMPANTTSANLNSGDFFQGVFESVANYEGVRVNIRTPIDGATNGLLIEWSDSGVSGEVIPALTETFTVTTALGFARIFPVQAPYFRLKYTNGASNMTGTAFDIVATALARSPQSVTSGGGSGGEVQGVTAVSDPVATKPVLVGAEKTSDNSVQMLAVDDSRNLYVHPKPLPIYFTSLDLTASDQLLNDDPDLMIFGFCFTEINGTPAAAALNVHHGTSNGDPIIAKIKLVASETKLHNFGDRGLVCPDGIYIDIVSGEANVSVYHIPETPSGGGGGGGL